MDINIIKKQEPEYGMDYLMALSYAEAEKRENRRELLNSLYSFRCLFDNRDLLEPPPALVKNGICFLTSPDKHPTYADNRNFFIQAEVQTDAVALPSGGVLISVNGERRLKFDVGSDLWNDFCESGAITGENACYPQKLSLYSMALELVRGGSDELRAMWYLFFPYIIMIGAPYEERVFVDLKKELLNEKIFADALESRYADFVTDSMEELVLGGYNPLITDWYAEYVDYKTKKDDKGKSPIIEKYQKLVALGRVGEAYTGAARLLDAYPNDEDVLLTYLSAAIAVIKDKKEMERRLILEDNIKLCEEFLAIAPKKPAYLTYFMALSRLGLKDAEGARRDFDKCLQIDPHFEPAMLMVRAIDAESKRGGTA